MATGSAIGGNGNKVNVDPIVGVRKLVVMGYRWRGRRVNTQGTRNADDVDRPSQIFPVITTRTDLKRHSRLHHWMDVLPSS
jgi:hypothetical protein